MEQNRRSRAQQDWGWHCFLESWACRLEASACPHPVHGPGHGEREPGRGLAQGLHRCRLPRDTSETASMGLGVRRHQGDDAAWRNDALHRPGRCREVAERAADSLEFRPWCQVVRAFLRIVAALGKKHRVTFLLLGHPSGVQKNSGEGGFGAVAWAATVRSRLYFDYIRDGKGKQISETRVLSRKKANYGRTDANGDGIFLDWQDWSFVEVDRPDTNDETPAKAKRTVDAATAKSNDTMRANLDKAVAETLRSIRAGYFSTKTLAEMLVKRDDIEVSVRKLEGELSTLWEDKTRLCHGMYDPSRQVNKGRWHCPEDLRGTFAGTARRVTHAGTETVQ